MTKQHVDFFYDFVQRHAPELRINALQIDEDGKGKIEMACVCPVEVRDTIALIIDIWVKERPSMEYVVAGRTITIHMVSRGICFPTMRGWHRTPEARLVETCPEDGDGAPETEAEAESEQEPRDGRTPTSPCPQGKKRKLKKKMGSVTRGLGTARDDSLSARVIPLPLMFPPT